MRALKSAMAGATLLGVAGSGSTAYAEPVRASESVPAAAAVTTGPVTNAPVKKMKVRRTRSPLSKESAAVSAPAIPIIAGATFVGISGAYFVFRKDDGSGNELIPVSP